MMMRRLWILFAIAAVIMLPAAITTLAMWLGVSDDSLAWNHLLMGLMLLPVMLRCFFLPQILCVMNGLYLLYEGICAYQAHRVRKGLIIGAAALTVMLLSFPGLEMFFQAMMGI
ncbi:MAG: hypothetical protein IJD99_08175 [Clostridia bacterium]|nr:hypothetical protein [Clostridia bacterium]